MKDDDNETFGRERGPVMWVCVTVLHAALIQRGHGRLIEDELVENGDWGFLMSRGFDE